MTFKPFLGRDPSEGIWKEWQIQVYLIQEARRGGYDLIADREASGRVGGAKAKAMGRKAGEPDMRYYLPMGRVIHIELKEWDGTVSEVQEKRHAELEAMGHKVYVVYAKTPVDGWKQVKEILDTENGNA